MYTSFTVLCLFFWLCVFVFSLEYRLHFQYFFDKNIFKIGLLFCMKAENFPENKTSRKIPIIKII